MIPKIDKLLVFYRERYVGTLMMDPETGCSIFEYSEQWLSDGFSISPIELPLQKGVFIADMKSFDKGFAIFEDSLPDGYGLLLIDRILRKQGASLKELTPLQRLAVIGNSGMGALRYSPVITGFNRQSEISDISSLDYFQQEALKAVNEKDQCDYGILYYNSGNSGGARPKIMMKMDDGTHWIIKFRHTYDPYDSGKGELLYMQTAAECGINIPRIKLLDDRYFAIERFDLDTDGQRLHVVTASALLKKNFRNQDLDYTNLLALTGYLTQDPMQVEQMYRRMVYNIVAINKDDHGKNFSFICRNGAWELAPAYDITYSPTGTNGEHATSVFYDGNPSLDLVIKAGTQIRIPESRCKEIISHIEAVCTHRLPLANLISNKCTMKRKKD